MKKEVYTKSDSYAITRLLEVLPRNRMAYCAAVFKNPHTPQMTKDSFYKAYEVIRKGGY